MGSTDVQGTPTDEGLPSIIVGYRDGIAVLDLVGEHDLTTARDVALAIAEQIARSRGIVVSLSEAEFLDSSVIRELFRGDGELLGRGRRLVVHTGANDVVRRVCELARVTDRLLCCDSLDEAIAVASHHSPS
jgi:anti-anti-sigma regulatory factor